MKLILLALALGFTASCGEAGTENHPAPDPQPKEQTQEPEPDPQPEPLPQIELDTVHSEQLRIMSPNVDAADFDTLIEGNTAFALDLLRKISPEEVGNLIYSPHSISMALAMAYISARNETEAAIASTMHFELDQTALHPAFNSLDLKLAHRGQGALASGGTPFKLKIVNAVWLQAGTEFLPEFLDTLALNYGSGVNLLDFSNDPAGSLETINSWVAEQTEEKIQDLLSPASIDNLTVAVLTNAIYFNATWKDPFPSTTSNDTFTLEDGTSVSVPMMKQLASYRHVERDTFHALELPYQGDEVALLILLPKDMTIQDFEASLTAEEFDQAIESLDGKMIQIALPKFKFEAPLPLGKHLREMGMEVAFSPDAADFSGMSQSHSPFISDVVHKAMISLNEKGTEAAAATAVVLQNNSVPTPELELSMDRPFLFFIRDIETRAILFAGRLADPR